MTLDSMHVAINFHNVASVRAGAIQEMETLHGAYWTRTLRFQDENGWSHQIDLFAKSPEALTILGDVADPCADQSCAEAIREAEALECLR